MVNDRHKSKIKMQNAKPQRKNQNRRSADVWRNEAEGGHEQIRESAEEMIRSARHTAFCPSGAQKTTQRHEKT